jgi:hypothetical protein
MNRMSDMKALVGVFLAGYSAEEKDEIWRSLSERFRSFWVERVMSPDDNPISEADCDEVIRILDRNGKGNTKDSEAVARAMIPQGAWRRMLNTLHTNKALGRLLDRALSDPQAGAKARSIDELYSSNAGQRNHLTGPSGHAVSAFLAAYDPVNNISVISVNDRRAIIEYLELPVPFDWDTASIGTRIATTNEIIRAGGKGLGLTGSSRTIAHFFYAPQVKALWKGEHTVKRIDKNVSVSVPTEPEDEEEDAPEHSTNAIRESMQIQGLLAKIGTLMGFSIWLPRSDRSRVLKVWTPRPGELMTELPLGFDATTTATIEQIDVLWLRKRSIARAFEVEHTTSVYSGLLRMADLVALQPNINVKLHIVAAVERREKVLREIRRPVFSLLEGRALAEMCTYLSYDAIREIGELKHLSHVSDGVLEDYEEWAENLSGAP